MSSPDIFWIRLARLIFSLTSEEIDNLEWYWQNEDEKRMVKLLKEAHIRELQNVEEKEKRETKTFKVRETDNKRRHGKAFGLCEEESPQVEEP